MRQTLRLTVLILIALALAVPGLAAPQAQSAPAKPVAPAAPAPPPAPCTGPEYRQLDFWVGEWDLTWPSPGNNQPPGSGTNRVEKILDGCGVQENFTANGPNALVGRSVSMYSAREKAWKQTWVDNQGAYIDLTGEFKDGTMTLRHQHAGPGGKPATFRMVFLNIKPDSFDWHWEASNDGGATWQLQWPVHYQRKGAPKG